VPFISGDNSQMMLNGRGRKENARAGIARLISENAPSEWVYPCNFLKLLTAIQSLLFRIHLRFSEIHGIVQECIQRNVFVKASLPFRIVHRFTLDERDEPFGVDDT
jgi:hypothetical protein